MIIIAILSGILGGLGMGGGTLLVPLLTLFSDVPQLSAQALNLLAFLPMSVCALAIHLKNKLVRFSAVLCIVPTAIVASVLSSTLAVSAPPELLRNAFGVFLIALGAVLLSGFIFGKKPNF